MNAALLVAAAFVADGNVIPAGWGDPSPGVIQAGLRNRCKDSCAPAPSCCAPAPSCCDPCGNSRAKLLDRIKARLGSNCSSSCAPACAPAPAPSCNTCNSCKTSLLDKIRARLAGRKCNSGCNAGCGSACGGCAAPAAVAPTTPTTPPKDMPKKDPVKEPGKTGTDASSPKPNAAGIAPPPIAPDPVTLPALPVAPISGPKLSSTNSRY